MQGCFIQPPIDFDTFLRSYAPAGAPSGLLLRSAAQEKAPSGPDPAQFRARGHLKASTQGPWAAAAQPTQVSLAINTNLFNFSSIAEGLRATNEFQATNTSAPPIAPIFQQASQIFIKISAAKAIIGTFQISFQNNKLFATFYHWRKNFGNLAVKWLIYHPYRCK